MSEYYSDPQSMSDYDSDPDAELKQLLDDLYLDDCKTEKLPNDAATKRGQVVGKSFLVVENQNPFEILEVTESCCKLLGIERSSLLGKSVNDIYTCFNLDRSMNERNASSKVISTEMVQIRTFYDSNQSTFVQQTVFRLSLVNQWIILLQQQTPLPSLKPVLSEEQHFQFLQSLASIRELDKGHESKVSLIQMTPFGVITRMTTGFTDKLTEWISYPIMRQIQDEFLTKLLLALRSLKNHPFSFVNLVLEQGETVDLLLIQSKETKQISCLITKSKIFPLPNISTFELCDWTSNFITGKIIGHENIAAKYENNVDCQTIWLRSIEILTEFLENTLEPMDLCHAYSFWLRLSGLEMPISVPKDACQDFIKHLMTAESAFDLNKKQYLQSLCRLIEPLATAEMRPDLTTSFSSIVSSSHLSKQDSSDLSHL